MSEPPMPRNNGMSNSEYGGYDKAFSTVRVKNYMKSNKDPRVNLSLARLE